MDYVLALAYRELIFGLHLRDSGREVTVVTYSDDVKEYCASVRMPCLYFKPTRIRFGLHIMSPVNLARQVAGAINQAKTLRKILDDLIQRMGFAEGDSFYLLGNAIAYEGFYLAKELAAKGTGAVYFRDILGRRLKVYRPRLSRRYLQALIVAAALRVFLGLQVMFYETNTVPRYGIDDRFFRRHDIAKMEDGQDFDEVLLDVAKKAEPGQEMYDNLILGEGDSSATIITYDSLRKVYRWLTSQPAEFAFKRHPQRTGDRTRIDALYDEFFQQYDELPRHVPVELLFNSIRRNVISVMSFGLIAASKFDHLRAISLLDLAEWHSEAYKEEMRNVLATKSEDRIIFVSSLDQLRLMLGCPAGQHEEHQ